MDYKEKYNKLVKAIEVLQKSNPLDEGIQNWVNENVPELRNSDDEKIRKELIKVFSNREKYLIDQSFGNSTVSEILTWLKKQKPEVNVTKIKPGDKVTNGISTYTIDSIEDDHYRCKDGVNITFNLEYRWKLVENEQKPETAFHEGDWIVDEDDNSVHQIKCVLENVTSGNFSYDLVGGGYFPSIKKNYHLWSIKDAKDGDVLHSTGWHNDCIFIFNGLDNWKFDEPNGDRAVATGYCCLSVSADNMEFGIQGPDCVEVNTIKPATKIQRDLLYQKMHEAGYTFDFEKKELKKLKFRVGDEVITENEESLTITRIDEEGYWSNELFICDFDSECVWDLVEQKSAEWKQENIEELTEFENAMMHIGGSFFGENAGLNPNDTATIKEQAELLLELAPKTEWSEEDERNLQGVIDEIEANKNQAPDYDLATYDRFLSWLKSLRPQKRWKPSKEQMDAMQMAVSYFGYSWASKEQKLLESLYKDLKKL